VRKGFPKRSEVPRNFLKVCRNDFPAANNNSFATFLQRISSNQLYPLRNPLCPNAKISKYEKLDGTIFKSLTIACRINSTISRIGYLNLYSSFACTSKMSVLYSTTLYTASRDKWTPLMFIIECPFEKIRKIYVS